MSEIVVDAEVWIPGAAGHALRVQLDPSALGTAGAGTSAAIVSDGPVDYEVVPLADAVELRIDRSSLAGRVAVELTVPLGEATSIWAPGRPGSAGRFPPSWGASEHISALDGIALRALVDGRDRALATVAATAGAGALDVRSGGVEETGRLFLSVEAGAGSEPLRVRLAMTTRSFTEAIGAAVDWLWRGSAGAADLLLSPGSLRPVYCTWYSMHLDVTQAAVLRQAEAAAGLGFGTVIIDDGWQTDEVGRGYGTAGDWEPSEGKFPSPRELMDGLHAQGLRGLWWIGTPFVGDRSRLAAQHVPVLRRDDALQTSVLDVRSPASREQLERHILELVRRTGADGVKVDFLEQFARPDAPSAPADADTEDVEEAALRMLRRLRDGLADTVVDPLIEYRQPYVGPAIAGIATMLRVGDCPLSDLDNRLGVIDLRLTTRGVAVHADPIMWAPEASAGRVAQSLLNALFGVPQVSVDLVGLPTPQRKALRFWLGFWARWSDVLLTGALTAHRPDLGYPVVEASADGITIVARYAPVMVEVQGDGVQEVLIAQADGSELLVRGLSALGRVAVSIVGPTGEEVAAWTADALPEPASFAVPLGGLLSARRA